MAAIAALGMLAGPALAAGETAQEPKPVNTEAPHLTGTPKVGQTLSCSQGGWTNNPTTYSYVWLRSGSPIAGQTANTYTVVSADQGHSISCQVTAGNSGGEYTISGLSTGSYRVEFSSFEGGNFLAQWYNGASSRGAAALVAVTVPNTASGINATLSAGGLISGRVTAAVGGGALANISACASDEGVGGSCATTNSGGEYTIQSLPSGTYNVQFSASGCGESGCGQQDYLDQSDGGVAVSAGGTTANVNAALAGAGQISGTVTAAAGGATLANIEVCAEGGGLGSLFGNCASTNAGGEYTIPGLSSTSYNVKFFRGNEAGDYLPQWYNGKTTAGEATPVAVTAGSTTANIDAALTAGGQISGRVTAAVGGAALANVAVCTDESGGEFETECASTNVGGEYTIQGLPSGTYKVEFSAFACGESSCGRQNYLDQSQPGVVVSAPSTTANIDAALATGGQISGRVTAAAGGAALAKAFVCASEGGGGPAFENCAFTNAGGEYTIPGLPSGAYNVSFSPFEEGGNYLSQSVNGVAVTAPNTTAGIDAALPPGGQISGKVSVAGGGGLANILVCASGGAAGGGCATTNGGGGSAATASNLLNVTAGGIVLTKAVFDAKTGSLDFFFQFAEPGTLRWSLFFKNADVGFADSLAVSRHKSTKCKTGHTKHRGRCVATLVAFAGGSRSVTAGAVEIQVHPDAKALKALNAGRTLHVSGLFTFHSALGGPLVSHTVSTAVHGHKAHGHHRHGKRK